MIIAATLFAMPVIIPSDDSIRRNVGADTLALAANSTWPIPTNALAAASCRPVI
ncbi:hypothetical protein NKH12_01190 [Mesorhizobium sp. M1322]